MPALRAALEGEGLRKSYGRAVALDGLDFVLGQGEVRALLGKNGAGKSTFVEILSGAIRADAGSICVGGKPVGLSSPQAAQRQGVGTVHQDLRLFDNLTVRENIALGRGSRFGVVSQRAQARIAKRALAQLSVSIPVERRVESLSSRDQQLVAIARAISHLPEVLILDEPTSALHHDEVAHLIALVRRLAATGVAVIYITHRLEEVEQVADTVTVLRDGREVATTTVAETSRGALVEMMLGRTLLEQRRLERTRHRRPSLGSQPVLRLRGVTAPPHLQGIDLDLWQGEIVGLWGLPGSGRSHLLRAIFGIDPIKSGSIEVRGRDGHCATPRQAIGLGIGLSPADRKRDGLVLSESVSANLVLASLRGCARMGVMSARAERRRSMQEVDRLDIKIPSLTGPVSALSGGNQQKVVVGKWLLAGTSVLLLDEPTQGVDVEAKAVLNTVLRSLAAEGTSMLLAVTEVEESLLCDRVVVLAAGRVVAEFDGDLSVDRIVAAAMGSAP
jgi:ABC-type sugar transport system ATPase subunit